jgi:hypothetical protein
MPPINDDGDGPSVAAVRVCEAACVDHLSLGDQVGASRALDELADLYADAGRTELERETRALARTIRAAEDLGSAIFGVVEGMHARAHRLRHADDARAKEIERFADALAAAARRAPRAGPA